MIFQRPIYAPNVILVDLPEKQLSQAIAEILKHIGVNQKIIGINAITDEDTLKSRTIIIHQVDYEIYREHASNINNVSNNLLKAGANVTYYIDASKDTFKAAFAHMYDLINDEYPIICVSNALTSYINAAITITNQTNFEDKKASTGLNCMSLSSFLSTHVRYKNKRFTINN